MPANKDLDYWGRRRVWERRAEVRQPTLRRYECPRCVEEIAPSAMWCPHCGYDLTVAGVAEQRTKLQWTSPVEAFGAAAPLFFIGLAISVAFVLVDLYIQSQSLTTSLIVATLTFVFAIFLLACDFSVQNFARFTPIAVAAFLFTTI